MAKFQDATIDVLWRFPVPAELRWRLQEDLLKQLEQLEGNSALTTSGLENDEVKELVAAGHFRLAKIAAEKDDRDLVLMHVRACLETRSEAVQVKRLQEDQLFQDWNNDPEFQDLYTEFTRKESDE